MENGEGKDIFRNDRCLSSPQGLGGDLGIEIPVLRPE